MMQSECYNYNTQSDQYTQGYRSRLTHLKQYLNIIRQQIQPQKQHHQQMQLNPYIQKQKQKQHNNQDKYNTYMNIQKYLFYKKQRQSVALIRQKQQLQSKIANKLSYLYSTYSQKDKSKYNSQNYHRNTDINNNLNSTNNNSNPFYYSSIESIKNKVPCSHPVKVYSRRIKILQKLQIISNILTHDQDWQTRAIFHSYMSIVLLKDQHVLQMNESKLSQNINFMSITYQSIQYFNNLIKFETKQPDNNYIFKFMTVVQAYKWCIFLKQVSKKQNHTVQQKWKSTQVICQPIENNFNWNNRNKQMNNKNNKSKQSSILTSKQYQKQNTQILNNLFTHFKLKSKSKQKEKSKQSQKGQQIQENEKKEEKKSIFKLGSIFKNKTLRKQSVQDSSFYLSNSSQNNVQNFLDPKNCNHLIPPKIQNQAVKKKTINQQQLINSFQFQILQQLKQSGKAKHMDSLSRRVIQEAGKNGIVEINELTNQEMQQLKALQQLSPKIKRQQSLLMTMKLLNKMQQKKRLLSDSSTTKLGIYWHEQPLNTSKDNNFQNQQGSPERYIPSPTQLITPGKSFGSLTTKKLDRSTKIDQPFINKIKRVQSMTRQKSDSHQSDKEHFRKKTNFSLQVEKVENQKKKSYKNQMRDHYLQRLIQKQTIKQISKSSSKGSELKMQQLVPPNNRKSDTKSPSLVSNYGSTKNLPQLSIMQDSYSYQQKQSTQQQIQAQQLKNGIVLQKCSKDAWTTKLKKLYISNAMSELCYCDVHNSHQEKKYFIRDIKGIQYGRATRGILKHKKKRCDQGRCLVIKIDYNGKQKLLQFYLQQSEPLQNIQDFAKKLGNFVNQQNQVQMSRQD